MNTKQKSWSAYITIAILVWIYYCNSGMSQYRTISYNLGNALVWPLSIWVHDSQTPKDKSLAGFSDGCNIIDRPEVKSYCECMLDKLDDAVPDDTDPRILPEFFAAQAMQLVQKCKPESATLAAMQPDPIINKKPAALMGDKIDDATNAKPNTEEDANNKASNKQWQDENGFIHYPDGSISNGPVD